MLLPDKIILIGMPGSGKTTVGKKLAIDLGLPFFDLDDLIESRKQKTIKEIFEQEGEELFRKAESQVLVEFLENHQKFVLASGGGTPCFFDNMDRMTKNGTTVFLDVPDIQLVERLNTTNLKERPLLNDIDLTLKIKDTLNHRRVFYERSHLTTKGANISAQEIKQLLEKETNGKGEA